MLQDVLFGRKLVFRIKLIIEQFLWIIIIIIFSCFHDLSSVVLPYIYIYMLVDTRLEKRRYIFVFTIYMCGTPLYYKVLMTGRVKIGSDQKIIRLK